MVLALVLAGCGAKASGARPSSAPLSPPGDDGRAATASFAQAEVEALGWLAAADPRLAARTGVTASPEVLERIGTAAVLAEDAATRFVGGSLDVFSFGARSRALAEARRGVVALQGELPAVGPVGAELCRPRLEKELLLRLIAEESARAVDEARLGGSAGDLVLAVVATWVPPVTPQEVPERDAWIGGHLLEIRDSLDEAGSRAGPSDLDAALYPLERLLAPLQFPRGTAALARLRIAMDQDVRVVPSRDSPARVARAVREHLGLTVDPVALPAQFASLETRLRTEAEAALAPLDPATRRATLGKARDLLFASGTCPPVRGAPVESMAPPPERAAVCGALRALSDRPTQLAAVVALHDEVQLSLAAVTDAPPPRTSLMSQPADDDVDALRRMARERPAVALAPALAASIALGAGVTDPRIAAWRDLGDVPLDVMARELGPPLPPP